MELTDTQATDAFEPQTETKTEHFACQDSGLSQIFKLIISTIEKILTTVGTEQS